MADIKTTIHNVMQRMMAFLFSWDAVVFCFFLLFAFGLWFVHETGKQHGTVDVEEHVSTSYTEKTIHLTIHGRGVQRDEELVLFPSEVTVTARVSVDDYNKVSAQDFQAVCTYTSTQSGSHLPIEVSCSSPLVTHFSISPQEAEFIVEKK